VPLQATSVRLDDDTLRRLGEMADELDRPRAWLMAYAIKQFVAQEDALARARDPGKQLTASSPSKSKSKKKTSKKNKK